LSYCWFLLFAHSAKTEILTDFQRFVKDFFQPVHDKRFNQDTA